MFKNVKEEKNITNIDYSEVYSKNEVAQFFDCLPVEAQDELLSIMRKMVADNKNRRVCKTVS